MPENIRTADLRYLYANAFGVNLNENEVLLSFGMDRNQIEKIPGMMEQTCIVMTPRSFKILAHTLMTTLKRVESDLGEIAVPPGQIEGLESLVHNARQTPTESPSQSEKSSSL
ncbi:MAG TPA: DUF3467 domain-containing protein [Acetobacteraceae bacterium]|nr:DUF3467 domain-containing protein [Acetobacteraceae bacterium]